MQRVIRETSGKTMGDADGWKRGEKGYGKDAASSKFATPNFDRVKQQGPTSDGGAEGGFLPRNKDKNFKGIHSKFADKMP